MVVIGPISTPENAHSSAASVNVSAPARSGATPHQPRADAVQRRRAQRLAIQRATEEDVERRDQRDRCRHHQQALPAERDAPSSNDADVNGGRPRPFGAEKPEAEPGHRKCTATETISSTSTLASASG